MSTLPPENLKPSERSEMSSGPLGVARFVASTFSTIRSREPPSASKTIHIRLITIASSHYCEKVRWAFDLIESRQDNPYYYTEDGHPAPFQSWETHKLTNGKVSATPMIVFEENCSQQVLYGSDVILRKFMPELYPKEIEERVVEMELDFGRRLGATIRCWGQFQLLRDLKKFHAAAVKLNANTAHVSRVENILYDKMLDKGIDAGMKKALVINEDSGEASLVAIRELFDEVSDRMEKSDCEYLLDTKDKSYGFTAADLAFAALAFPILRPPEMKSWLVDLSELPKSMNDLTEELINTKAGQYALNIYKKPACLT